MAPKKPDLEALIAAGPQLAPTSRRTPIGVPADYRVDTPLSPFSLRTGTFGPEAPVPTSISTPPRYFEGDEWVPASMGPAKVAELQRQMAQAGLFGKKGTYRNGVWDAKSARAYAEVLAFANASGMDEVKALSRFVAEPIGDDDTEREPLVKRLSNPDDLRSTFETVARTKLGRKLAPEDVDRFVRAYQAEEAATQQRQYDLAGAEGGMVTEAADPRAFLSEKIRREYGVEAGAHDLAEQGGEFMELLREVGG